MGLRAPTWVGAATEGSTVRAIWKGAVSFGLVNVPVRLYSATENHDVQFRQVHREDGGRIKYQRVCSVDGEQVAYEDIAKGYETEDGRMVVLTDEDLKELPVRSSKEITVEKFVPREQIDPIYFDKTYYLQPDQSAMNPGVSTRMKPARQRISAPLSASGRAIAASKAARSPPKPRWSMQAVGMPSSIARPSPAASGRLQRTRQGSAGCLGSAMSRASASMFEPDPEIRIATRRRGACGVAALTDAPCSARRRPAPPRRGR